ncbi:diacylglycerol kinase family protein, partial [Streptomyces griseoruber]|uniref:diacylglycerol kinase family protein n=1 Tax=Streptomyces griseoruber TaxID=1943 RepID=UPI0009A001E4
MATFATPDQLLVIIDPIARRADGESVRIAKDVLSAGAASTKVCLPESPEEFARVLARRGSRRLVVIGDDRTLTRTVSLLHRQRELAGCVLSMVPVGTVLGVAHALGIPTGAVAAARAVLDGAERRLDLLVDDSDGVVLGALRIPPLQQLAAQEEAAGAAAAGRPWLQSLVRTLVPSRPPRPAAAGPDRSAGGLRRGAADARGRACGPGTGARAARRPPLPRPP